MERTCRAAVIHVQMPEERQFLGGFIGRWESSLNVEEHISVSIAAADATSFSIVVHLLLFRKESLVFSMY